METSEIIGTVGGVSGGGVLLKYIWDYLRDRNAHLESKVENERDSKIDTVLRKLSDLELQFSRAIENITEHKTTLHELKERINGVSENHGARLSTTEKEVVELRTRLQAVERRRR